MARPSSALLPEKNKLAALRSPAKRLREARRRLEETQQSAASAETKAESLAAEIAAALATRGQGELTAALDGAGNLVSQLRRRLQIEQRLEQLGRYQAELEERSRVLVDRQPLPLGVIAAVGVVFVLGVTLVLAGLFMPASVVGPVGWALALLGLAASAAAAFGKVMLERSAVRRLEACQKQLAVLRSQVQQAKDDREAPGCQVARRRGRFHR